MQRSSLLRGMRVCTRTSHASHPLPRRTNHVLAGFLRCPSLSSSISSVPPALRTPTAALHTSRVCCAPSDVSTDLAKDIKDIIEHDRLVVFLTGTPEQPRCRFTVQLVDLFNQLGIKYSFFNILDDEEVCEGLKTYSDWPTYPQVYLDGELLGGYDICKKMMLDGELIRTFKEKDLM